MKTIECSQSTNQAKQSELRRAITINKSLGTPVAARYMALRGWSIEAALHTLTPVMNRITNTVAAQRVTKEISCDLQ